MRATAKLLLFGMFMVLGLMWVEEASAFIPSGGSRLLYYFSKKSFAAGAANDSAQTLLFISNTDPDNASRVGIKYYRGDCGAEIGPVFQNIGAGATLRVDVAAEAPTFQEGTAEVFFVNGANAPIRWDRGAGSSVIIDFPLVTVVRLPAAFLHSDSRTGSGVITNNASGTTFAPTILSGNFADPSVITTRMAIFAPGTVSGTVSPDRTVDVTFRREDGAGDATLGFDAQCGRTQTLAQIRGLGSQLFQNAYPSGGVVAPQVNGQQKGIVGWLVEVVQLAGVTDIVFGQTLQGVGTSSESAHP